MADRLGVVVFSKFVECLARLPCKLALRDQRALHLFLEIKSCELF